MTSPTSQPSIADAARLMDALSFTTQSATSGQAACSAHQPKEGRLEYGRDDDAFRLPTAPPRPVEAVANNGGTNTTQAASTGGAAQSNIPSLPLEIIFHIASQLFTRPDLYFVGNLEARPFSFPCQHCSPPYSALPLTRSDLSTLLSLSSASRSFRHTLMPLVWHTIVIRTPQHLPRLCTLLKSYDTLSIRSTSPQRSRRSSSPYPDNVGLRHPLPYIRGIVVCIPDKYIDLDQSFLLTLLRSMHLSYTHQLEYLYWSAEAVPNPAIWPLVGPSLRSLEVDGRTFYHGHRGMAGLERLESLKMVRYESTLLPIGARVVFEAQAGGVAGVIGELPEGVEAEEMRNRGQGQADSPVMELQRSTTGAQWHARQLYPSPPPLSPTATPHRARLTHLSLSSSKTSLLHQPFHPSTFSSLTHLDIYPVTPEPPLSQSLLTTAATLTHLRLVLDVSGAFDNFNTLWSDLTGKLPVLEWLEVDPMPQQNTAPSFWSFVERARRLRWINGKEVGSYPPCFGAFDPDHPSGALPY